MCRLLAAVLETIFVVMGKPETKLLQGPLAMDKWLELVISHPQIMLGLHIITRRLTVGVPTKYRVGCRDILTYSRMTL